MKKLLLLFFLSTSSAAIFAQGMIVNRYFNSATADGTGDVVELVVVQDHLNIRKWFIKDYGNGTAAGGGRLDEGGGKFRFNDIPFWGDLRSGTVIVLRKRTATSAALPTFTPTYTPDVDASDFIIDIDINDTNYMTDIYPDKAFNVTPHEMVLIRADVGEVPAKTATPDAARLAFLNGANNAVHALAYGDFNFVTRFNEVKSPKAIFSNGNYNTTNYVGNGTVGMVTLTNPNVASYLLPLTKSTKMVTLPAYWVEETTQTASMPYGIEVYKSTTDYTLNPGTTRKMKAYCVVVDPKYVDFKPTYSATNKTPEDFVNDEPGTVLACVNAGFFGTNVIYSMMRYEGTPYSYNISSVTRPYMGGTATYYPTRATFGLAPNLKPDVTWTYNQNFTVYSYDEASPNELGAAPQPQPTTTSGVNPMNWSNVTAVGGSPMLIKNNVIVVEESAKRELAEFDNTSPRARTAIGHTADGKILIFSIEGENPGVSDGLTLEELANYMKDAGCTGAINLDGGGSSVLRIGSKANSQQKIIPSPAGVERAMPGVILIKSRN